MNVPVQARLNPSWVAALFLIALGAGPVAAQESRSIFTLLETGDRAIEVGGEEVGRLTESDYVAGGRRVQAWALEGRQGQVVQIDMISEQIDPYMYLVGPGLDELADDDGGDGTNARLCLELPATGRYRVVASAFGDDAGEFRLQARERTECPLSPRSAFAGVALEAPALEVGASVEGSLDADDARHPFDGSLIDVYAMEVAAGETRVVDLASDQFDAFLFLIGPGSGDPVADDDGGGRCNARIVLEAPESGTYRVVVNTLAESGGGDYTLRVSARPGPLAEGPCGTPRAEGQLLSIPAGALAHVQPEPGRVLPMGSEVPGELGDADPVLEDDSHAQAWTLDVPAGETVIVELMSDAFDPILIITGPGLAGVLADDDSAGGTNARITFTAGSGGTYRVIVNSFGSDAAGDFRLRALRRP